VGDQAPVIHSRGNGIAVSSMRWGFAPARKGAAPVFNFRAEGRRFHSSKRCIVLASAFFEFTGSRSPKSKWRFHVPGVPIFGVAGLWHDEPAGPAFTMLTLPPGDDVRLFHDRQIAVLTPPLWPSWIFLERDESALLAPAPAATLRVDLVRAGAQAPPAELLDRTECHGA
jgi:putative SOS response-associated peptidase YedK